MASIKLFYFDSEGRAEHIRLAFLLGDVPYEDVRLSGPEFGKLKQEGKFKFGQLPVLEVDGKQFAQSAAIAFWAAKRAGIHPKDPVD